LAGATVARFSNRFKALIQDPALMLVALRWCGRGRGARAAEEQRAHTYTLPHTHSFVMHSVFSFVFPYAGSMTLSKTLTTVERWRFRIWKTPIIAARTWTASLNKHTPAIQVLCSYFETQWSWRHFFRSPVS
jgi:hypothetical protein